MVMRTAKLFTEAQPDLTEAQPDLTSSIYKL